MPEGPSILILRDASKKFKGKKVLAVSGDSKIDQKRMLDQKVTAIESWGKHFLIGFKDFTIRVHFLLFGSYTIDEKKKGRAIRLGLKFSNGEINFYSSAIKLLEGAPEENYDWSSDVLSDEWNSRRAKTKLKKIPDALICDALLDQDIFSGVGNIIKNEVLYRVRVHPESKVGKIPPKKLNEIVKEAREYSFDFLKWKKKNVLRKHWLAHKQKICARCNIPFQVKHLGRANRRAFYCANCETLYK